MKHSRSYPSVVRRWYRPVEHECPECHRRLREAMTLSRRTVITLQGVIRLTHAGYRCPDAQCPGHQRTYRSVEADAVALPRMTYGLDIVLLVGGLHLREHRTVDEIHQELLKRLKPLGVKIARREILYLFEAYCTPSKPAFEADRKVKTAMRKTLQPKVRAVRKQLKRDLPQISQAEAEQLAVLDDYATGLLTALNRDGTAPFDFAAVQAGEDLDALAASLERLEKKGQP
jgi:hypothetical protein